VTIRPLVPHGEGLRHAVQWLAEHERWSPQLIEEACQRFDLDPRDEEFLLAEYRRLHAEGAR
jgi:hypothetical protein